MNNDNLAQAIRRLRRGGAGYVLGDVACSDLLHWLEAYAAEKRAGPVAGRWVPTPITEAMHEAACKVLLRAHGLDGTPKRMLDAMLAAAPSAPPSESDKEDAERWRELRRQHEGEDSHALAMFGPDDEDGLSPIGCMPGELDAAIDAARVARAKKDNQ